MNILALDTSTPLAGVAVVDRRGGAAVRCQRVTTHSEMLLCLVRECLGELRLAPADLQGVVCGSGPGSFTGLRIGAATAKGLCYALGARLALVSSLLALAAQAEGALVLASTDAYRGQVYARLVVPAGADGDGAQEVLRAHPTLGEDRAWDPEALALALAPLRARLTLVGDGPVRYPRLAELGALLAPAPAPPPLLLARLGRARLLRGADDDLMTATPNYAALSAAEQPRPAPRDPSAA